MAKLCSIDGEKPVFARGWCHMHWNRWRRNGSPYAVKVIVGDRPVRILSHVHQRGPDECWPWTAAVCDQGYARTNDVGDGETLGHRVVYELLIGPIPEGMTLDHTCHSDARCGLGASCPHRRCCNPAHLEPVPLGENVLRGDAPSAINARRTHCRNGHPFNPENTGYAGGKRYCRICRNARRRERYRDLHPITSRLG